jgi:hypothetical protein
MNSLCTRMASYFALNGPEVPTYVIVDDAAERYTN